MDSYSDYENPLLGEMHNAEKLSKELGQVIKTAEKHLLHRNYFLNLTN